ncbi:MAG: helicase C-terminal domain-containing protein [Xenococcaceae cyanobacterium MO_167.B52]|nr:helicase C-terminal domain-containing protein [Xenococcaceae cyanobacterium MO_167.B52]
MPFAYAITTHKAQGSSIDYCFVDVADMRHCPDLQKILYTALTRATKTAFIPQ